MIGIVLVDDNTPCTYSAGLPASPCLESRFAHGPAFPCPAGRSWEGKSTPEGGQEEMELYRSLLEEVAGREHQALPGG